MDDIKTAQDACNKSSEYCELVIEDVKCSTHSDGFVTNYYLAKEQNKNKGYFQAIKYSDNYITCSTANMLKTQQLIETKFKDLSYAHSEKRLSSRAIELAQLNDDLSNSRNNINNVKRIKASILNVTQDTNDQDFLLWRWANLNEVGSRDKLVLLDKANSVTNAHALYFLSQHYARNDSNKSLTTLKKLLLHIPKEEYMKETPISSSNSKSLHLMAIRDIAAIYYRRKEYSLAYVFTHLLFRMNDTSANVSMPRSKLSDDISVTKLKAQSLAIYNNLANGLIKLP